MLSKDFFKEIEQNCIIVGEGIPTDRCTQIANSVVAAEPIVHAGHNDLSITYIEKISRTTLDLMKKTNDAMVMLNIAEVYFKVNRNDSLIFIQQEIKLRLNKAQPGVLYSNTQYSKLAQKAKKDGFFKWKRGDRL